MVGWALESGDEESLIGWKGESFKPGDVFGSKVGIQATILAYLYTRLLLYANT